ncbi:MAG: NrfD/PsrC family molybdoenzyme membrane anchor subunit [Solirubrobacteraceae bacterium]
MNETRSYHGQPVLKEPVWTWEIPCYLFTGGLAGASAGLAYLCELRGDEVLARRAWGGAFAGIAVSPALLISDLGRPRRFLNMLRLFKVTSPMSVGSWILTVSATTTAIATAHSWLGVCPRLAALARPAAALAGLPLSTYTGALVANTAVPVWHESRQMLPFVFASGAGLSAGAAGLIATPPRDAGAARRLALGSVVVEMATKELMERRLGDHGEPYRVGAAKRFGDLGRGCLLAGSAVLLWRGASSRRAALAAGTLLLTGALSARWSVFKAGFTSVADPKYVVGPQRERVRTGTRRGAARSRPHAAAAPGP